MSAPTLPAGIKGISPFVATRVWECAAPWACAGIGPGDQAAYVGVETGFVTVCAECAARIAAGESPFETATEPQPAGVSADALVTPDQVDGLEGNAADFERWDGELCECPSRADGFSRDQASGRWVHNECGYPALRFEDGRPDDGPIAVPHQPDPAEPNDERPADEGDDPADATADAHVCECKRVTSRAKFGRTADGRPTHEHCGGVLREKHRHLAPAPETTEPETTDNDSTTESEAQTHDGDDAGSPTGTDPGAGAGTGEPTRSAHGAARSGEGRRVGGEGAGEGADRGDQGRGVPAGQPGDAGGDDPQQAHAAPVEGEPAGGMADRLEGAQGGGPSDVGALGEEDHELSPRAGEVAGGLAAFFAQPLGDEPEHTLADFFAQPVEDDETWGAPVEAPDSDNYLGEFSIAELAAELGHRREVGGTVTALVVDVGELTPRIVAVPR